MVISQGAAILETESQLSHNCISLHTCHMELASVSYTLILIFSPMCRSNGEVSLPFWKDLPKVNSLSIQQKHMKKNYDKPSLGVLFVHLFGTGFLCVAAFQPIP